MADSLADGWQYWKRWQEIIAPGNVTEIRPIETDAGRYCGYVRAIGRLRADAQVLDPDMSIPAEYVAKPLLRG